jgi:hypothetical protein
VRGETTASRKARATDSEAARARKRAAFLAKIRQASQVELPRANVRATEARSAVVEVPRPRAARRDTAIEARPRARAERDTAIEAPRARAGTVHPVEQPQPAPRLFREEALQHRLAYEEGRGLVRVSPPWTWALLWVVVSALVAAVAASFVGQVEVTGRGRGILRPAAGVRVLTNQLGGTITRVEARSGERVTAGTALLHIESPAVQAQLLEADRELEALRTRYSAVSSQQDLHYTEQIENLKARAKRAADQIESSRSSARHF